MRKLYSYCLKVDDGAAPNPFGGICSLAICKPPIRRAAQVGDWIVGHGSARSPIGDISDRIVYAMRVSRVVTMPEYDELSRTDLVAKLPNVASPELWRRAGDSIYDFQRGEPQLRPSVHKPWHMAKDLSGRNVLLSDHFFYFGENAVPLRPDLHPILRRGQGFKSNANAGLLEPFEEWVEGLGLRANELHGDPIDVHILTSLDADAGCDTSSVRRNVLKPVKRLSGPC